MSKRTNEEILGDGTLTCSIPEAARVLNVTIRTIAKMCDEERLHTFPVGRRRRVGVASLRRLAGETTV